MVAVCFQCTQRNAAAKNKTKNASWMTVSLYLTAVDPVNHVYIRYPCYMSHFSVVIHTKQTTIEKGDI